MKSKILWWRIGLPVLFLCPGHGRGKIHRGKILRGTIIKTSKNSALIHAFNSDCHIIYAEWFRFTELTLDIQN